MGEVLDLREVLTTQLARQLAVSNEFVSAAMAAGFPAHQAAAFLRWFLAQPTKKRFALMKGVLGGRKRARR